MAERHTVDVEAKHGGCSSMAEHLTVAQVVVGSRPIIRPCETSEVSETSEVFM